MHPGYWGLFPIKTFSSPKSGFDLGEVGRGPYVDARATGLVPRRSRMAELLQLYLRNILLRFVLFQFLPAQISLRQLIFEFLEPADGAGDLGVFLLVEGRGGHRSGE